MALGKQIPAVQWDYVKLPSWWGRPGSLLAQEDFSSHELCINYYIRKQASLSGDTACPTSWDTKRLQDLDLVKRNSPAVMPPSTNRSRWTWDLPAQAVSVVSNYIRLLADMFAWSPCPKVVCVWRGAGSVRTRGNTDTELVSAVFVEGLLGARTM